MTDNDTNRQRLWGAANETGTPYVKDAFNTHVCGDNAAGPEATRASVKPAGGRGTKAAAWTVQRVEAGQSCEVWFRFLCGTGEGAATAPVPRSGIARAKSVPSELSSISAELSADARDAVDAEGQFSGHSDEPAPLTTTASVLSLLCAPLSFGGFVSGEEVLQFVTCTTNQVHSRVQSSPSAPPRRTSSTTPSNREAYRQKTGPSSARRGRAYCGPSNITTLASPSG